MKGSITSGVVYPLAVCELAGGYRLRNIGGTSAGAIAATAAAAAQYGHHSAQGGFPGLTDLRGWLGRSAGPGQRSNLSRLFQTGGATAPLLTIVKATIRKISRPAKVAAVLWQLLWGGLSNPHAWAPLVAVAPAVLLAALNARLVPDGLVAGMGLAASAALTLLVAIGALAGVHAARRKVTVGLLGAAGLGDLVQHWDETVGQNPRRSLIEDAPYPVPEFHITLDRARRRPWESRSGWRNPTRIGEATCSPDAWRTCRPLYKGEFLRDSLKARYS
jgi:hypothetical protein